jgi:hypothetical protein
MSYFRKSTDFTTIRFRDPDDAKRISNLERQLDRYKELEAMAVKQLVAKDVEIETLKIIAERDYLDMRHFQAKFIAADQDLRTLRAALEKYVDEGNWFCGLFNDDGWEIAQAALAKVEGK